MKITKFLTGLFLISINMNSIAQQAQPFAVKTYGKVTSAQEKLITGAFLYLNKFWADKGKSLSKNITKQHFTPDTTLIINGKIVYRGFDEFENHFKAVGKKIIGQIRFLLLEVTGVSNKLIVHFDEDIHDNNGNYYPTNVIAIFTLKNNKIQQWKEVVNSKYFCQEESANVVYSK